MANVKINTYQWTCDRCGVKAITHSDQYHKSYPEGWGSVRTHGWGMTDYSKDEDRCPACVGEKE